MARPLTSTSSGHRLLDFDDTDEEAVVKVREQEHDVFENDAGFFLPPGLIESPAGTSLALFGSIQLFH